MSVKIISFYQQLLTEIGENPHREGLSHTPQRALNTLKFLTRGYHQNLADIINNAIYVSDNDEMVILKNIELYSLCEHHLLPFFGKAHIGYLPNKKVIGISKIARIVDHFACRLQIQENLTKQIADCLAQATGARGVGVIIHAQHFCMIMRGVEKQNSIMKTSMMLGSFRSNEKTRSEFIALAEN